MSVLKSFVVIGCLLLAQWSAGQPSFADYHYSKKNLLTPAALTEQLTNHLATDRQKVTSIFRWITDNIRYRTGADVSWRNKQRNLFTPDSFYENASLDERIAYQVINDKVAVCDGYARLFKTLCLYAGIKAEVITGYARGDAGHISKRFASNHSWNAVYFDSAWHLLDVTWASGYFTYTSNQFIQQYDDNYFLTPPQRFISDHYPEDLSWTLLPHPTTLQEFYLTPFKYSALIKYSIPSFAPAKGIIEATEGDSVQITLTTPKHKNDYTLAPDAYFDSTAFDRTQVAILYPDKTSTDEQSTYTYIVDNAVEWLLVLYNNEPVMRYKMVVKERKKE